MSGRPRRSAAMRAQEAIADIAETSSVTSSSVHDNAMSNRNRRADGRGATVTLHRPVPSGAKEHLHLNVKVSSSKLHRATNGSRSCASSDRDPGVQVLSGKRNRAAKKNYVITSESDEEVGDDDAEGEDEDEMMDDLVEEDADGEPDEEMLDVDAEGEEDDLGDEDADGEEDLDMPPAPKTVKVSKMGASKPNAQLKSSDDELSDLESYEDMNQSPQVDEYAEGEEDAEGEDEDDTQMPAALAQGEDEDDEDLDDDEELSRAETPDLSKMTKRQRARFEDEPQQYMKLSDEVQVKKHLTAEEQSMRRAEMARRRRNLSEKRNEEVKMETINKLLKKQAPKTNRKAATQADDEPAEDPLSRPNPMFLRWVSSKEGSRLGVTKEIMAAPTGQVYAKRGTWLGGV